jgi:putative flippase GtrA
MPDVQLNPLRPKQGGVPMIQSLKNALVQRRQFVLYCLIGASGVTLDFLTYSALLKTAAVNYQVANAAGYSCGTVLSFLLNARFNFKTRDWLALRFLSFCTIAFLGWAASAGTLWLLVARFDLNKYLAKLLTIVVVVLLQYNLNRLISFRKAAG